MKHIHIPTIEELMEPDKIRRLDNGNYAFTNIPYQGKKLQKVEFCPEELEFIEEKTQQAWAKYSATNKEGWCVTDAEILYQCMLQAYELRNDAKYQKTVQELRLDMQEIFDSDDFSISTLTKVSFGSGLDAIISSLGPIKKKTQVTIPEFTKANENFCYLVLAREQPEENLGETIIVSSRAHAIMRALLGEGYRKAGTVFQYFTKLKDGNLREARLWTPTATNRKSKMAVCFGLDDDERFTLTIENELELGNPALGVRIK